MSLQDAFTAQCDQLLQTEHQTHEAIVRFLQDSKDSRAVPYLAKVIALKPQLAYLDYDDYGSFYKKCLWALQAIGTDEAIRLIQRYAEADDKALSEQAQHRLQSMVEKGLIRP